MIPGIQYVPEAEDFWTTHCRAIWKYYQTHPDGPFSFGWWDSVPGRPQARVTHADWLKQYAPMVEEGSWAWLEINDSNLFRHPMPQSMVASVFANREIHLVIANYGRTSLAAETVTPYVSGKEPDSKPSTRWQIAARSLVILKPVETGLA